MRPLRSVLLMSLLVACTSATPTTEATAGPTEGTEAAGPLAPGQAQAVFAGGCFWCMEKPLERLDGVISVESGYTGGDTPRPTYEQVSRKQTTHIEAVRVVYDPTKIDFDRLLYVFWRNIDPLDGAGQFCDKGPQYTTAIWVSTPEERAAAEASKAAVAAKLGQPVATAIRDTATFWLAEDYHQDYYLKNPVRYAGYRYACGRDARLQAVWGDEAGGLPRSPTPK